MVVFKSDIVPKSEAYLRSLEAQVELAVKTAMQRTGLVSEARVKSIFEKEAYDTGRALRSVTFKISKEYDQYVLTIGSNLAYVFMLEFGRKPGKWPNLDAITQWVGRKLRRQGVNTRVNVTYDQLKQLAKSGGHKATAAQKAYRQHLAVVYLVGRKIATKGIREKLIFTRIKDGSLAYFRAELNKQLQLLQ